ncbi:MAG: DUF4258 domain-containing protein [Bryobacterales bacterium]|nr:DUF4258 domain-containing protein [Bryobacterales bacterium]
MMELASAALPDQPLAFIRACVMGLQVRWTYHSTMRLRERRISAEMVLSASKTFEVIESYPDDKYLPSYLVRATGGGLVLHAQFATDVAGDNVRVVTVYVPSADDWDEMFRNRRK